MSMNKKETTEKTKLLCLQQKNKKGIKKNEEKIRNVCD